MTSSYEVGAVTTLGAILNGGLSTRMGRDKTDIEINGTTMLQLVSGAIGPLVSNTVLLGPERAGHTTWPDAFGGQGPLAGIATALSRTTEDQVLVVAVDQPFIRPTTIEGLIHRAGVTPVVPVDHSGVPQVTCAIYPASLAEIAVEEARAGGSIQSLLDVVSFDAVTPDVWQTWGEDGRSWFSIDSPDDLSAGIGKFGLD